MKHNKKEYRATDLLLKKQLISSFENFEKLATKQEATLANILEIATDQESGRMVKQIKPVTYEVMAHISFEFGLSKKRKQKAAFRLDSHFFDTEQEALEFIEGVKLVNEKALIRLTKHTKGVIRNDFV